MRYSYTLPKMDSEHELVLAYLDTLGVRLDPSIVWNAVRFSFIVDWVVDVSSFLAKMARDNYPIHTTVHDFCHSLKWHKECTVHARVQQETQAAWFNPTTLNQIPLRLRGLGEEALISSHTDIGYDRRLAKPDYSAIAFRALKLRQAALAGSLVLARTSWGSTNSYQYDQKGNSGPVRPARLKTVRKFR
jgi:hypothetical protein